MATDTKFNGFGYLVYCRTVSWTIGPLVAIVLQGGTASDQSWLPQSGFSTNQVRYLVCQYAHGALEQSHEISPGTHRTGSPDWTCSRTSSENSLEVKFRLISGSADDTGVAVAFDFADWSPKNYLLIPAVVYNGNRLHTLAGGYMPTYPPDMYFNPNLPVTMSDNPRLSLEKGKKSLIELLTGNAATPAIAFYCPSKKRGFILLCEQKSRFGNNGLIVEESEKQDRISFIVSAPGVRKLAAGFGGFGPSGDTGAGWSAGDTLTLKFKTYEFPARGIPDLLEKFMSVRKDLTGPNHPRNRVPMSETIRTVVPRFKKRWATVPAGSYYLPENSPDFQLGWVSGFMQTPMLAINDPKEREHICQQMDFVIDKLQGTSGLFYGGTTAEGKLRADRSIDNRVFVLTRKNGDALIAFFKYFAILKAQGHADLIKPSWENAARKFAQAFVALWRKNGQFGQYLDPKTGEIAVFNSTSGAVVPAGLALASKYFGDASFLKVAQESAKYYFERDVIRQGFTGGYCADTSQDPDSDSTYALLESCMTLDWATHNPAWIQRSRVLANLGATWTLSYDHEFPKQSDIGKMDGHMAGAVWASAQNKHAAPGICTASGDYLFKLYRATGNSLYADLIRDIQHAHVEATEMPGHRTTGTGIGASMERIQPTDGEGKGAIGNFIQTQNAWTELNGLMMATELPGIYVRTDTGSIYVFDHVTAKLINHNAKGVVLQITNQTPYEADIKLLAEPKSNAMKPLDPVAYLSWPKVRVGPGQTVEATISLSGKIVKVTSRTK